MNILCAVLCMALMSACDSSEVRLEKVLRAIQIDTLSDAKHADSVASLLRGLREEVYTANSAQTDSLFNQKVNALLKRINTPTAGLILASYVAATNTSSRTIPRRVRVTNIAELGHAFRSAGDYHTARSLYGLWYSGTDPHSKANHYANLAMEYMRIGHDEEGFRFAQQADSLFEYTGGNEGRLWTARLLFVSSQRAQLPGSIRYVRMFHDLLQTLSISKDVLDRASSYDGVVTLVTMFHELMLADSTGRLAAMGFGKDYPSFKAMYESMSHQSTPVWQTHSFRYKSATSVALPAHIIRHINTFDGDLPAITPTLGASADSSLVAITPIGDYVRTGNTWVHTGHVSWTPKKSLTPYPKILVHHTSPIVQFVRTTSNSLVVASHTSVTNYMPAGNGTYRLETTAKLPDQVFALAAFPRMKDAVAVLSHSHLRLLSLPNLNTLADIYLPDKCSPDTLGQYMRLTSIPELYLLNDSVLFAKTTYGTITIAANTSAKPLRVMPHLYPYEELAHGLSYQVDPLTVRTMSYRRRGDTNILAFGVTAARSAHELRSRRIHLAKSATTDIQAFVSGDRADVFDKGGSRLHPFIHLPLPFEVDDRQPDVHYFISRKSDIYTLDYAHEKIIRSIDLAGQSLKASLRYYSALPPQNPHEGPKALSTDSPIEVPSLPFSVRIVDNSVATRCTPIAFDGRTIQYDMTSPYGYDVLQTINIAEGSHPIVILNPSIGRFDTISVVLSNAEETYELVQHVSITTLFLGTIAGVYSLVRRRRERRRKLVESIRQQQVEALREDMHDVIGSRLVRIASLARNAAVDSNDEVLARIHDMTLVAARSLRNLLALMADSTMTNEEYYGSLREYVAESCTDARMDCTIHIDVDESITLDNTQRHELLMIISEMLTNTIRHARATHTSFSILVSKGQSLITWADNGTGIDPASVRGNGLSNMKRRAARINATIDCHTSTDEGTRYEIRVLGTGY